MNGPDHFREAQVELDRARGAELGDEASYHLAKAQVHATLALTAATALQSPQGMPCADRRAWHEAAAAPARSVSAA